jgi:hypothetical protein
MDDKPDEPPVWLTQTEAALRLGRGISTVSFACAKLANCPTCLAGR